MRKSELSVIVISLSMLLCTFLFFDTRGFISDIEKSGRVVYCCQLNTLGSDADNSFILGYLFYIPTLLMFLIFRKFQKVKLGYLLVCTPIFLLLFFGMTSAERADIWLTITHDWNIPLLLWCLGSAFLVPLYLFLRFLENRQVI